MPKKRGRGFNKKSDKLVYENNSERYPWPAIIQVTNCGKVNLKRA